MVVVVVVVFDDGRKMGVVGLGLLYIGSMCGMCGR